MNDSAPLPGSPLSVVRLTLASVPAAGLSGVSGSRRDRTSETPRSEGSSLCLQGPGGCARKYFKSAGVDRVSDMGTRQIVLDIPEKVLLAERADEATFGREMRILAAVRLYELGRLSSGRAAELAGMSRVEFLLALGRYKVFPFEAELRELEAAL